MRNILLLLLGDDKLTTFQLMATMSRQGSGIGGVVEFSTPGAVYERKLSGRMLYTDINNQKALTLSTERFGKTGAVKVSYNTVSRRTSVEMKHNFLTTKDITTRILFFNDTSSTSSQMGIQVSGEYDWYKFKHVTKVVVKDEKYLVETHTQYMPKKSVTAALEFNTAEKQMRAIFDINQVRQAVEIIGRLESSKNERGVTFTFVHVPTQKTATLYTGYKVQDNKKEIMTTVNIMGKEMKNILGWYKNGDIQSIEDFFSFQGKTAKLGASWENRADEIAIQLSADVFGRKALSTAVYNNKGTQKFIDLSARVLDKEVSSSFVITTTVEEKSVVLRLNSAQKPTELTMGMYNNNNLITLKVAGKAMDNRASVFVTLDSLKGYKSSVGFTLNKYTGGVRGTVGDNQGCADVYYKTPVVEKVAMKACGELNTASRDMMTVKQLIVTIELPQLKQKVAIDNEFFMEMGRTNIKSKLVHNNQQLVQKSVDVVYKGFEDCSISVDVDSDAIRGGVKLFSNKPSKSSVTDIGVKITANNNDLLLLNRYEPGQISSAIYVNNKPLPVTTVMMYEMGAEACTSSLSVNIGEYSVKTTANIMHKGKYGIMLTSGLYKNGASVFGVITNQYVEVRGNNYALVQKGGVTIQGVEYVYGWTLGYDNMSTDVKSVHAVKVQVHYSNTKSSTITFTFTDSPNKASVFTVVEYVPSKRVAHFIVFNKNRNSLEASVEFLPKMFAKFSSRLEKGEGYMLQTQASLQWKGFRKSITIINSFVNNEKNFMFSTNFARDLSIGVRINKLTPTITLFGDVLGNRVQLEAVYQNLNLAMTSVVNGKTVFQVKGGYDQWAKTVRILAAQQEKVLLDIKSSYNKVRKSFNLAVTGVTKWGGVYITRRGFRTILNIDVLGKGFAKAILNMKEKSITIHTLQYPRFSVSWRWVPKSKTLSMSIKTLKNRMMINLRTDWTNKILALNGFMNKERVGCKLFFVKKAMIMKLTLAPQNIMKATFTTNKNTLRLNLQRIVKGKTVNQMAFSYHSTQNSVKSCSSTMLNL
jgi:hypothetical protein